MHFTRGDVLKDIYDYKTRYFSLLFSISLPDFSFILQPIISNGNIDSDAYRITSNGYFYRDSHNGSNFDRHAWRNAAAFQDSCVIVGKAATGRPDI